MAIEFVCNSCGKTLRVPDEHLGKKARCPACQGINVIQTADQAYVPDPSYESTSEEIHYQDRGSPLASPLASPSQPSQSPKVNPYASTHHPQATGFRKPHRGGLVLTLGLIAFVCNFLLIPGILAWVYGRSDLKEMKAGIMDREGESLTTAGMILGIIATVLPLLGFALYLMFVVVIIIMSVLG